MKTFIFKDYSEWQSKIFGLVSAYIIANQECTNWEVTIAQGKRQRTKKQNSALHKFFRLLGDTLNAAGLDMRKVLKPEVEIPWTDTTVKTNLWKPIQEAIYETSSTTELSTEEV